MSILDVQQRDLESLHIKERFRRLVPGTGFDFSSNDYLGLAGSTELRSGLVEALERGVAVGSGGSRLLRGNRDEHEELEREAATFFGCDAALYLSSGFSANTTLLSTLPQRNDKVFADRLVHASCHDGLRLSRAPSETIAHNDPEAFSAAIKRWRTEGGTGTPWIVVESLYSMDGDRAPLPQLLRIAKEHDGMLIIDEAHATGVFGPEGRGLAADLDGLEQVIIVRTCGKALGCEGALVCGNGIVREFLVNRGRGFIFSTAPSPLMAAAVRVSLGLIRADERRQKLRALIDHAAQVLGPVGAKVTGSQIMPLIIGEDRETMRVAKAIQAAGFDVRGIRPPTVPAGSSRLRISLTLNVDHAAIDGLADAIRTARR